MVVLDQQVPDTQPGRSGRRLAGIKRDERSRNRDGARYVRRPNPLLPLQNDQYAAL